MPKLPALQLKVIDGYLYYPPNPAREWRPGENLILLHRYPEGDCDSIKWPLTASGRKNLPNCLFNDRETGAIGDQEVLLPDGSSAWGLDA